MKNFNNMVEVLGYFAEQCNMFQPLLDGILDFEARNQILCEKIKQTNILYDRMQLNSTYLSDNANFSVEMIKKEGKLDRIKTIDPILNIAEKDRYNLIKAVISVGKDNYDRDNMEQLIDFYSMLNILTMDEYEELLAIIDEQHKPIAVPYTKEETLEDKEEKKEVSEEDTKKKAAKK